MLSRYSISSCKGTMTKDSVLEIGRSWNRITYLE